MATLDDVERGPDAQQEVSCRNDDSRGGHPTFLGSLWPVRHPHGDVHCTDLGDVAATVAVLQSYQCPFDIIVASPPCQGFSLAKAQHDYDIRRRLTVTTAQIIATVLPRVAIMENVAAAGGYPEHRDACDILRDAGYRVESAVVDAAKLRVPQRRRRLITVATRAGVDVGLVASAAALRAGRHCRRIFPGSEGVLALRARCSVVVRPRSQRALPDAAHKLRILPAARSLPPATPRSQPAIS